MSQSPSRPTRSNTAGYVNAWAAIQNMVKEGRSWSGNERNCAYLNTGDERFANCSWLSGLDFKDDARGVASVDWDLDGDLDLWLSNRTGPRLRFMRNESPPESGHIALRLVGKECNRDAVGARVELRLATGRKVRSVRAGEGFVSQSSRWVHFGLGGTRAVESVVVRWPGGAAETFSGVEPGGRYVLEQGRSVARRWTANERRGELAVSSPEPPPDSDTGRVILAARPPVPTLPFMNLDGAEHDHRAAAGGRPILIILWSSTCAPCLVELKDLEQRRGDIEARGLILLALSVDQGEERARARDLVERLGLGFRTGFATERLLDILETMQRIQIDKRRPIALPSSFLVDGENRLAAIYRGPVEAARLLEDLALLPLEGAELRDAAVPFEGIWISNLPVPPYDKFARDFALYELPDVALEFLDGEDAQETLASGTDFLLRGNIYRLNAKRLEDEGDRSGAQLLYDSAITAYRRHIEETSDPGEAANNLAVLYSMRGRFEDAIEAYELALPTHRNPAVVHENLVLIHLELGRVAQVIHHLREVIRYRPDDIDRRMDLATHLLRTNRVEEAMQALQETIGVAPRHVMARQRLGEIHMFRREFEDAEAVFREAQKIDERNAGLRIGLARVFVRTDRLDDAEKEYLACLDVAPRSLEALLELAALYSRKSDPEEALEMLDKAHALVPENEPTLANLIALNLQLGRRAAALRYHAKLEKLNPVLAKRVMSGSGE